MSVIPIKSAPKKETPAPYDKLVRPRGDITHDAAAAQWHAALLRATAAGKIPVEHMSKMSNSVMVQQKLNDAARVSAENIRLVAEVRDTVLENTRLRGENAELKRRLGL